MFSESSASIRPLGPVGAGWRRTVVLGGVVAVGAIVMVSAGCSSELAPAVVSSSSSLSIRMTPQATHNATDVDFTTMMIPHHQQALVMADLVAGRSSHAAVIAIAARIKSAQEPEIEQMKARLSSWSVAGRPPSMRGHSGQSHAMAGMMDDAQLETMRTLSGTAFDRMWIDGMIAHHQGAVDMANAELAGGIDTDTRQLAANIKSAQQREIEQLKQILAGL